MRALVRKWIGKPGTSKRFRFHKWLWRLQIPAWIGLRFLDEALFNILFPIYLVVVSIYALDATFAGAEQAAKSKEVSERVADVREEA